MHERQILFVYNSLNRFTKNYIDDTKKVSSKHITYLVDANLQLFVAGSYGPIMFLQQKEFCDHYHTEDGEEHDEDEETHVGAFLGAGGRGARAPSHRAGEDFAWARAEEAVSRARAPHDARLPL